MGVFQATSFLGEPKERVVLLDTMEKSCQEPLHDKRAPNFHLPAVTNDETLQIRHVHLEELRGKVVVLLFFPKDGLSKSVQEIRSFRESYQECVQRNVVVLGIAPEHPARHKQFARRYQIPFPLLSDVDLMVARRYGLTRSTTLFGTTMLLVERATILVDPAGIVRKMWHPVISEGHAQSVLASLETLQMEGMEHMAWHCSAKKRIQRSGIPPLPPAGKNDAQVFLLSSKSVEEAGYSH